MKRLPKGWRRGHDDALACPHRDCTVCDACRAAHVECVDVFGACFWVPDVRERAALLAEMSKSKRRIG